MKFSSILFISVCMLGCSSSNEIKFYKTNTEILNNEYNLQKEEYQHALDSYFGTNYESNPADSLEKIILRFSHAKSNLQKDSIIKNIEGLFSYRRTMVDKHFFDEIYQCNYDEKEKITYYLSLMKLTFVNAQLINYYQYKFSFDMIRAHCEVKNIGDTFEVTSYLAVNNFQKPNFLVVGKDTLVDSLSNGKIIFTYKKSQNDSSLENAKIYHYSSIFNDYVSEPLNIEW